MLKKLFFISFSIFLSYTVTSNTFVVTNSGFTFSPSKLTIYKGDTVNFQIASIHTVIEVSHANWNINSNASNGGFTLGSGGGKVHFTVSGVYYYVCGPHASLGMKGIITVLNIPVDTIPVYDTTKVTDTIHVHIADTSHIIITDSLTIHDTLNYIIYDTLLKMVTDTVYIYDTSLVVITDSTCLNDTSTVFVYDTLFQTKTDTLYFNDTIHFVINDSVMEFDTLTKLIFDTSYIVLPDTVQITDTTYITVTDTILLGKLNEIIYEMINPGEYIDVSPNPAHDMIMINVNQDVIIEECILYNLSGIPLKAFTPSGLNTDISLNYPPGTYLLTFKIMVNNAFKYLCTKLIIN